MFGLGVLVGAGLCVVALQFWAAAKDVRHDSELLKQAERRSSGPGWQR